jgi:tRNA(Ile)-lysidine synthase
MSDFLTQLQDGLSRCGVDDARVLLAVSGGPDSVAMLRGIHSLADRHRLVLHAAHLNHQLRGEQANLDARWIASLCEKLRIPLTVESIDVAALATGQGLGIEEAARVARYDFLQRAASRLECTHVAVAHTADDQAETILHHILRGTGLEGLRGMQERRDLNDGRVLVRPLLQIDREQIEGYLEEIGQDALGDATNFDERLTRNRIRHSLMPLLRREYNPRVGGALRNLGRQADELQSLVRSLAAEVLRSAIEDRNPTTVRLNCGRLSPAPRHLVRECFALLWKQLDWPRQKMGFDEWDRLAELIHSQGTVNLPGNVRVVRRGQLLVLSKEQTLSGEQKT